MIRHVFKRNTFGVSMNRLRQKAQIKATTHQSRRSFSSNKENSNSSDRASFLSLCLKWYSEKLDKYPITTKSISSGIISGFGDLICQSMTEPTTTTTSNSSKFLLSWDNWDSMRTCRFATLGTLWIGPVLHYWYGFLSRTFPHQTVLRVAIDQFFFAPISLTTFLSLLWWWEGETASEEMPSRLTENVPSIVVANWSLWIPAQAVNFHYVSSRYQVLFSNFVALAWNAYLSFASRKSSEKRPQGSVEDRR